MKYKTGLDEAQTLARLHSQMPSEEKMKRADVIIDTGVPLAQLKAKVAGLWQGLP